MISRRSRRRCPLHLRSPRRKKAVESQKRSRSSWPKVPTPRATETMLPSRSWRSRTVGTAQTTRSQMKTYRLSRSFKTRTMIQRMRLTCRSNDWPRLSSLRRLSRMMGQISNSLPRKSLENNRKVTTTLLHPVVRSPKTSNSSKLLRRSYQV